MNMSVMDGLPSTTMNEAVKDVMEQAKAIVAKSTEKTIGMPEGVVILTREELLEVENLSLKIQLLTSNRTNFMAEATKTLEGIDTQLNELRGKVTVMQGALSTKYGIDFKTQQIQAGTGIVLPVPPQT